MVEFVSLMANTLGRQFNESNAFCLGLRRGGKPGPLEQNLHLECRFLVVQSHKASAFVSLVTE